MSANITRRSSQHPLGGISRVWNRRLLRFYVPLTVVSILLFSVFLTLPRFDPRVYSGLDMHSSGWFPQSRGSGGSMDMTMDHNEDPVDGGDESEHGGQTGSMGDDESHSQGKQDDDQIEPADSDNRDDGDESKPTGGGH